MTLEASTLITFRLLSLTLLIQAAESLILTRESDFKYIWSFKNLRLDLLSGLPLPPKIIETIFSIHKLQIITLIQIITATITAFAPSTLGIILLIITHLLMCIRFRGSFNGGSDMMTFVVLTGALIASTGAAKVGMIYIATHALFSYFKAGLAKAKYREWWNGQAISTFLSRSLFPNIQMVSTQLIKYRWLSKCAGWLTLFFEFSVVGLLFFPQLSMLYMAIAIVFHLSIYFCFGLNRFFWIWITTWPAILYSLSLLN